MMGNDEAQEEKNRKEGVKLNSPPPTDGLRRSRRLQNQLFPPPGKGGRNNDANERKRPRRGPRVDGDDAKVKISPKEANVDEVEGASIVLELAGPLQNSLVLANLFEFCSSADLAKCRLVCKEWRDLSLTSWRKSATLKVRRDPDNGRFYIGAGWTSLPRFLKYVEDPRKECGVKPFRRIKLQGWNFYECNLQIQRFWDLTGSHVTSLDIHYCRLWDAEEFWTMFYEICPNLERLSLHHCSFDSRQYYYRNRSREPARGKHEHLKCLIVSHSQLPVSWLELLSHLESLTSLEVRDASPSVCEPVLNAIKLVRGHGGNKLPLEHFDVRPFRISHDRTSREKLVLLRELNIPLNSLIVSAHRVDLDFVSDILEAHAGTLEYLELQEKEFHSWRGRVGRMRGKFTCPVQLDKLHELKIEDVFLESIDILKSAPNLRTLSISGEDGLTDRLQRVFNTLEDWQAEHATAVLPKLTKLTYFGHFGGRGNLITLAKLMPNVEELHITLNDQEFSTVCEHWKGLKALTVEADVEGGPDQILSDKGVTGGSMVKQDMRWVHKAVHPNITDLKELRSFTCATYALTHVSVYKGFLKLPKLHSVRIFFRVRVPWGLPVKPNHLGHEAIYNDLRKKGIGLQCY